MSDDRILFHQYDSSPFSEKVRVVFGIKGLSWCAVDEPVIMPKPELTALTGGYRKIPVMQIGADVWCDSQSIVRELERRFPEPSLHVGGDAGLSFGLGFWTDRELFQAAVAIIFGGIGGAVDEAFRKDREALMGRPFDPEGMKSAAPIMREQFRAHLAVLDTQLCDGRDYLLGERPGLADATAYYNLWFVRSFFAPGAEIVDALPRVAAWETRVRDIGHGDRSELHRSEAIAIAKANEPGTSEGVEDGEPGGLRVGDTVRVMADDYGRDPVIGTLASASAHEIAIRRSHEDVGEVVVHFPRAGFWVLPAG